MKKAEKFLVFLMILNFSSLTITVFMLENACGLTNNQMCVREANPFTSHVFNNYGYGYMYLVLGLIWFFVYRIGLFFEKKKIRHYHTVIAILITPIIFLDFLNNFSLLAQIFFAG